MARIIFFFASIIHFGCSHSMDFFFFLISLFLARCHIHGLFVHDEPMDDSHWMALKASEDVRANDENNGRYN